MQYERAKAKRRIVIYMGSRKHETKSLITSGVHTDCGEQHQVIRRTITVDDDNNRFINSLRGRFLETRDLDVDFTTIVNMFIALARHRWMSGEQFTEDEEKIVQQYLYSSPDLEMEAVTDQQWDRWLKHKLPQLIESIENPAAEEEYTADGKPLAKK